MIGFLIDTNRPSMYDRPAKRSRRSQLVNCLVSPTPALRYPK